MRERLEPVSRGSLSWYLTGRIDWLLLPLTRVIAAWTHTPAIGNPLAWAVAGAVVGCLASGKLVRLGTMAPLSARLVFPMLALGLVVGHLWAATSSLPQETAEQLFKSAYSLHDQAVNKSTGRVVDATKLASAISKGEAALKLDRESVYLYTVSSWYLQLANWQKRTGNAAWQSTARQAVDRARQAVAQTPRDANALAPLAAAALFSGDRSTAILNARRALRLDPANELAKMVLRKLGEL